MKYVNINRSHYGFKPRKLYNKAIELKSIKQKCPICKFDKKLTRVSSGIWSCKKCNYTVTSLAYEYVKQI